MRLCKAAGRLHVMEVDLNARQDSWAAARALAEGASADAALLAVLMGRARETVRRHAKAEGWRWVSQRRAEAMGGASSEEAKVSAMPATLVTADAQSGLAANAGARADAALDHAGRVSALADRLMAEMEAIERDGQGAGYDKARIDAVSALTRALEKIGEFSQSGQNRKEAAIKTDEELAAALRRINDRILELARDFAAELAGRGVEPGAAAAGGR